MPDLAPAPPPPPRLYLVTDRHATGGRPLADVIRAALEGAINAGLPPDRVAVQLREKDLPGRLLLEIARTLREVTAAAGAALYVNDRLDVALAVGADGVHLGGGALSPADAARLHYRLAIAVSTHGASDVSAVRAVVPPAVAFAVCGPVRETPSKRRYGPPLGLAGFADAVRAGRAGVPGEPVSPVLPVLAIGGITPGDVRAALRAGAAGVACIRAVMGAPDPGAATSAFCQELK